MATAVFKLCDKCRDSVDEMCDDCKKRHHERWHSVGVPYMWREFCSPDCEGYGDKMTPRQTPPLVVKPKRIRTTKPRA